MNKRETKLLKTLCQPQHGQRAYSLVDLIEKGTMPLELAAWLASQVAHEASWIVCSGPGGVGKTTTMLSLLPFVPANRRLGVALPGKVRDLRFDRGCLIAHELSDHPPATYLWDQDLRDYLELGNGGQQLAGNMHVDQIEEAHSEIIDGNGVPERHYRAINLFLFLRLEGHPPGRGRVDGCKGRRYVQEVYHSTGTMGHQRVYTERRGLAANAPGDPEHETQCAQFLADALRHRQRSTLDLRERFLAWERYF